MRKCKRRKVSTQPSAAGRLRKTRFNEGPSDLPTVSIMVIYSCFKLLFVTYKSEQSSEV